MESGNQGNALFNNILNDLGGAIKDNSKLGTLIGSPKQKMPIDFNARQFENLDILEDDEDDRGSSHSDESPADISDNSYDDEDFEEMEFDDNRNNLGYGFG